MVSGKIAQVRDCDSLANNLRKWSRWRARSRSRRSQSPAQLLTAPAVAGQRLPGQLRPDDTIFEDATGLSLVYDPKETPLVDVIFIHGLGGASVKSWCYNHEESLFWPGYWLPNDLDSPNVRISTFGYNAEVISKSKTVANISDFGKSLLAALKYERTASFAQTPLGKIPIVFVAHSMGGLVVKKVCIKGLALFVGPSDWLEQTCLLGYNDANFRDVTSSIRSIVFLSTPHRGSALPEVLDKIMTLTLSKQLRRAYVKELARESSTIEGMNEDFRHHADKMNIFSFYETNYTALKAGLPGSTLIVAKDSALLGYPNEKSSPLDADHHGVCKFESSKSSNYKTVSSVLNECIATCTGEETVSRSTKHKSSAVFPPNFFPPHGSIEADYQTAKERRAPGTCQHLLQNQHFLEWTAISATPKIFWLYGEPGSGKTIKASFFIDHFKQQDVFCHYYFFRHDDEIQSSIRAFVAAMASQLYYTSIAYRQVLNEKLDLNTLAEISNSRHLWNALFDSVYFVGMKERPIYWIIDAIDECVLPLELISILASAQDAWPLHLILISRDITSISNAIGRASVKVPLTKVNIDESTEDIEIFIGQEATHLQGDATFHASVAAIVRERAQGSFLWARLVMQELQNVRSKTDVSELLDALPSGMEPMYARMATSISLLQEPIDRSLAETILRWLTYAKRPLLVSELERVLEDKVPSLVDFRYSAKRICGNFIRFDTQNRVTLIHLTAREYLRQCSMFSFALESCLSHGVLLNNCIQVISAFRLRHRQGLIEIPPLCEYASSAWGFHLEHCSADNTGALSDLVGLFRGSTVLSWLEVLAFTNQMSVIVSTATNLKSFVQRRRGYDTEHYPPHDESSDLLLLEQWSTDLSKIVAKFGAYMSQDTSAIYKYIPALSPINSQIFGQFARFAKVKISVTGNPNRDWDDLSARLSVGSAHLALIVCASSRVVGVATSANCVRIWDVVTFEHLRTLEQGEIICRMAFDPTGKMLAVYGMETTRIFGIPGGQELRVVGNKNHEKSIFLKFIGASVLLTCSVTRKLLTLDLSMADSVWKSVHSGVFKLEGTSMNVHRNTPTSVDINADSSYIAIAYRGAPLEVWNLETCEIVSICTRSNEQWTSNCRSWTGVNQLEWNPVKDEILGLYTDGAVFKWDPLLKTHHEVSLTGPSASDIRIASDGKIFLTSNGLSSMNLYGYEDFCLLYQVVSDNMITAMTFSPDCRRFYDIQDSYCNVWEPNILMQYYGSGDSTVKRPSDMGSVPKIVPGIQPGSSLPPDIVCLAINLDETVACYGDDVGNVTLFDLRTEGKMRLVIKSTGLGVERIVWADDNRTFGWEDLARRLHVGVLSSTINDEGSRAPSAKQIFERKVALGTSGSRFLQFNASATNILAIGHRTYQVWTLGKKEEICTGDLTEVVDCWASHPTDSTRVLAFTTTSLWVYAWNQRGLREISRVDVQEQSIEFDRILWAAITTKQHQTSIIQYGAMSRGRQTERITRFLRMTIEQDQSQRLISTILPLTIENCVERPVKLLGGDILAFIDKDLWVCTYRIDYRIEQEPTLSYQDAVVKHFFLPRDWVNADNLALCTVLNDGTFVCPKKGELVMIRSGLGSDW